MSNFLFDQFEKTTAAAWKQKIQVDLKGADYNETLLWKTDDGILVKPFYTKEDRKNNILNNASFKFNVCQSIFVDNEKIANNLAIDAIQRGANSIEFIAQKPFNHSVLLTNIDVKKTPIYFRFHFLNAEFTNELSSYINSSKVYFQIDIIGHLAESGNWFYNLKQDYTELKSILNETTNSIGINATVYQNAGATITQQLAYTLAHANEYLNYFGEKTAPKFHFNFSVGSNYFFEIAKLRAFKKLWNALLKEYHIENCEAHIFTQPSLRNKTIYDYNVNMLRTTSECMSAILGGSNTVCNISYDTLFRKKNEFGERISRNQLLILQQESNLESANKISDGSYYIESLTSQIAEKALLIFKEIEKGGGFLNQLKQGIIQRKIEQSALKEQDKFNTEQIVLLGTNKQPNKNDKMKDNLELYPFVKIKPIKTLISPIIKKRLAEAYEKHRINSE